MLSSRNWCRVLVVTGLLGPAVSGCTQGDKPKSLLVITMDTTRADRLGPYGYSEAKTPTSDRLARQGTLFERAYAVTPETLPSHVSIFTGLYPPSHAVRLNLTYRLPEKATTLAEIFREQGFYTVAVIGATVLDRRYGLNQGFEIYDGPTPDPRDWRSNERSAKEVTEKALAYLAEQADRPYFLWVHYYDPHSPFEPQPPFEAADDIPPESPKLYDLEIAYMDHWIGKLLDGLDERGELEETLVVLTADHGESLGEHGETYHTLFIYDATIHVPLILAGPGVPRGKRVQEVVSSVDLFSTLLTYFDIEPPATSSRVLPGLPLSPRAVGQTRYAYSDSMTPPLRYGWNALESIRTREWLYIRAPDEELYRLDGSDPGQDVNLHRTETQQSTELRRFFLEAVRSMPQIASEEDTGRLPTEDELRALAALGYVAGRSGEVPEETGSGLDPKDMVEVAEAFQLALFANRVGKNDVAEELLTWASEIDPDNFAVWVELGRTLVQEGEYGRATESFGQALEVRPGFWQVMVALAATEQELGHLASAEKRLEEALTSSPFPQEVWQMMGRLRLRKRDWTAADEAYRKVLELDPEDKRARQALEMLEKRLADAADDQKR